MAESYLDVHRDAALAFVNELRAEDGRHALPGLLRGKRGDPDACPLATSAPGWAFDNHVACRLADTSRRRTLPIDVRLFQQAFDDEGAYPDLDIDVRSAPVPA